MDYQEFSPPAEIAHLVKAGWSLDVGSAAGETVRHIATPDGCIEIVRRLRGQSRWGGEQPPTIVAGLIVEPAELRLSGDAQFIALRLWPWTWDALGQIASPRLVERWTALEKAAPGLTFPDSVAAALALVTADRVDSDTARLGRLVLKSRSVAALVELSGRSYRWWQRWFARHVGISPNTYLRLLRFQDTLAGLPHLTGSLADHAAANGFADQAHMSRDFRSLSGTAARRARDRVQGPFVAATDRN